MNSPYSRHYLNYTKPATRHIFMWGQDINLIKLVLINIRLITVFNVLQIQEMQSCITFMYHQFDYILVGNTLKRKQTHRQTTQQTNKGWNTIFKIEKCLERLGTNTTETLRIDIDTNFSAQKCWYISII